MVCPTADLCRHPGVVARQRGAGARVRRLCLRAGQSPTRARRHARRRYRSRLHARRGRASHAGLPRERRRAARDVTSVRAAEGYELRRCADRRAAIRRGQHVAPPVRRHVHRVRLGLDAGARRAAAARDRPRLRALRPRRLAGPPRRHRGDRRTARLGDPRLPRAGRALPHGEGPRRARDRQPLGGGERRDPRRRRRGRTRMKAFARLYSRIDSTTSTNAKVAAMGAYFREAEPADAAWAVYFLSGGRPKRLIPVRRIAQWAMEEANVPDWLFDECYDSVGDLAETIALLLPATDDDAEPA